MMRPPRSIHLWTGWIKMTRCARRAEADYYKTLGIDNFPRNQGFTSLEEMLLVRGFDVVRAGQAGLAQLLQSLRRGRRCDLFLGLPRM